MSPWTTIREIKTKRFTVKLQWEPEQDPDLSWMDADGRAKLDSGEWTNCCFRVAVYLDGARLAWTTLGNSVYADPAAFACEHYGTAGSYFPDMLREVVAVARARISTLQGPPRLRLTIK